MTATIIRDAIYDRLTRPGHGYTKTRKTPVPMLHPDHLPALSVFVLDGRGEPDGDDNAGQPRLSWSDRIGVSIVRGFADPLVLEGAVDAAAEGMITTLLTDPTFVRNPSRLPKVSAEAWTAGDAIYWDVANKRTTKTAAGNLRLGVALKDAANPSNSGAVDSLFEAVTGIARRWVFPEAGETHLAELRVEFTFRKRQSYDPIIPDAFLKTRFTARPSDNSDAPAVTIVTNQPQ